MALDFRLALRRLSFVGVVSLLSAAIVTAQVQAVRADRVAWVVFVDDLHLDFRNTDRVRKLLYTILSDVVHEKDLVAIRTTDGSLMTDFTSNRKLMPLVGELSGHSQRLEALTAEQQTAAVPETRHRARISLSSAVTAVALLGQVEPRRRALLYISNGHPFDVTAFIEARALAGVAGQNRVKIFAIDGRVLDPSAQPPVAADPARDVHMSATRTSLRVLAEQSGGFAILDGAGMEAAFQRITSSIRR